MSTGSPATAEAILAIRRGDGRVLVDLARGTPKLPRMEFPGQHPPMNSKLTERVRIDLGLEAVLLEQIDFATAVLQTSSTRPPAPSGFRWVDIGQLTGERSSLAHWSALADPAADWFRPGWFARADDYIDERLLEMGRTRRGRTTQVKHWSMSAVLRTPTDAGAVYLKATLPLLADEPGITRHLSSLDVGPFATIRHSAPSECWWLADDFGGVSAIDAGIGERLECVRQLVRIQRATMSHVGELSELGCRVLDSEALSGRVIDIIGRDDLWLAPDSWKNRHRALSSGEVVRLRALVPRLLSDVEKLDRLGVPATLVHRDLHLDNAVIRRDGILLHDWGFATIASPLLSLASWLDDAREADSARYVDAYVDAWRDDIDPELLRKAWRIAKPLAAIAELDKFITLVDVVGPRQDFSWLPMTYGWCRRLLSAAADRHQVTHGWRR